MVLVGPKAGISLVTNIRFYTVSITNVVWVRSVQDLPLIKIITIPGQFER